MSAGGRAPLAWGPWLFILAFVCGLYQVATSAGLTTGGGWETTAIAREFARTGRFANPFQSGPTGLTAVIPPLFPVYLGLLIRVLGDTPAFALAATGIALLCAGASCSASSAGFTGLVWNRRTRHRCGAFFRICISGDAAVGRNLYLLRNPAVPDLRKSQDGAQQRSNRTCGWHAHAGKCVGCSDYRSVAFVPCVAREEALEQNRSVRPVCNCDCVAVGSAQSSQARNSFGKGQLRNDGFRVQQRLRRTQPCRQYRRRLL